MNHETHCSVSATGIYKWVDGQENVQYTQRSPIIRIGSMMGKHEESQATPIWVLPQVALKNNNLVFNN